MILFVVPASVALANRPPRPPALFSHISTWRLVGGEIADGFKRLSTAVREFRRWPQRGHCSEATRTYPSVDEWAHRQRLVPARVRN